MSLGPGCAYAIFLTNVDWLTAFFKSFTFCDSTNSSSLINSFNLIVQISKRFVKLSSHFYDTAFILVYIVVLLGNLNLLFQCFVVLDLKLFNCSLYDIFGSYCIVCTSQF